MYGVFSVLTIDFDESDAEEMLYAVHDDKLTALVGMNRLIVYRAFMTIPHEAFKKLVDKLIEKTADIEANMNYNVAGLTYYVRELSEDEAKDLLAAAETTTVTLGK